MVPSLLPPPLLLLPLLLLLPAPLHSYRVLLLQHLSSGSHELVLNSLGEQLAQRGHNITQLRVKSTNCPPMSSGSVKVIDLPLRSEDIDDDFVEGNTFRNPIQYAWRKTRRVYNIPYNCIFSMTKGYCRTLLDDPQLVQQLRRQKFDLAVVDLLVNECGLALAHKLGLPVVGFWNPRFTGPESFLLSAMNLPSVVPHSLTDLWPEMSFLQRVYNTLATLVYVVGFRYHCYVTNQYIQKLLPAGPDALSLLKAVDITLVNNNFLTTQPVLLPPSVQSIGCIQCQPARPLAKDLDEFMWSSGDHGVVVFSLGVTIYDPHVIQPEFIQTFMTAFGKLKQKVLVRYHLNSTDGIPANVRLADWIPQRDVLGHPKTRLFVGHCGLNGVMESIYNGVPILGVPIFNDQGENAKFIEYRGLGIAIEKDSMTTDSLLYTLNTLIYNETYRQTARRTAAVWRAEGEPAIERVEHWMTMKARFGRLPHLQMLDHHLGPLQYWLLDVLALLVAAVLAAGAVLVLVARVLTADRASTDRERRKHTEQNGNGSSKPERNGSGSGQQRNGETVVRRRNAVNGSGESALKTKRVG